MENPKDTNLESSIKNASEHNMKRQTDDNGNNPTQYKSLAFVVKRILIISCGSFSYGYSWTIYNQLFHVVKDKYGWPPEYEDWTNGAINSVFIFSAILGCLFLSFFQNFKRLHFFIAVDVVAILGSLLCYTTNTYIFFIGRII